MALGFYSRDWPLDNIIIRSGGDGRTVEAYAAVFGIEVEVNDQHGRYNEIIDRSAFNRTLAHGIGKVGVFYNHGKTLYGTPSDLGSVPIGTPLEIRADSKGLFTVTRYNRSALADSVLEAIRNGDIRAQSFTGRVFRSNPQRIPRIRAGQPLPTVTRLELGLAEYGPTFVPMYEEAAITAVRSAQQLADEISGLDEGSIAELIRTLTGTSVGTRQACATPENAGLGTEDSRNAHSARQLLRLKAEYEFSRSVESEKAK